MKRIAITSCILFSASVSFAQDVPPKREIVPTEQKQETTDSFYVLTPVEVKAIRAGEKAPFTKTNLSKKEIQKQNLGQDLPFILNQTPSVVVNSDAGNGVGYTGIRIRGTDLTRINVTLNGIPYNDAESQGTFFVDLPDFISSVNSIQVQRGAGTSSNGAGAFGATINMSTNEVNMTPYAELNNSYGSFNTWKNTVKAETGLIGDHFTTDIRLSRIISDGFIDRATSDLKSFYFSTAYLSKKTSLRLNIFSGKEETYQAWNGVPEAKLRNNDTALINHYWNNAGDDFLYRTVDDSLNLFNAEPRKYNYFTYKNQTDNYTQTHYQLFFNQQLSNDLSFNTAFFLTQGKGYYEESKIREDLATYNLSAGRADLVRRLWLDNDFYGGVFSLQYKKDKTQATLGGSYTRYDGNHFGEIIWASINIPKDYRWYQLDALKTDFTVYGKYQYSLTDHWQFFADLQYRKANYTINGFRKNPSLIVKNDYDFFNPKLGLSYSDGKGLFSYLSFSVANKEPNRGDFETGLTQQPKSERLKDWEAGIEKKDKIYSVSATMYYMNYKNQLVLTGMKNDVGEYTRTNVPASYRAGIELQGDIFITSKIKAGANLAISKNKVKNFNEFLDDYDFGGQKTYMYKSTDIALSPNIIGGATFSFIPGENFELSLLSKYISKQYLDNTENEMRKIDAYYLQDARIIYSIKKGWLKQASVIGQLNNIFNKKYEANGYTYSYIYGGKTITENFYYPMAGTNFMIGVNINL